ncbi:MAG: proton-conducting transporter membrane subunit [candidate division WOR-3 bacterium]
MGGNILLYPIIIPFLAGIFTLIVPRLKRFKQSLTVAVTLYLLILSYRLFNLGGVVESLLSFKFLNYRADWTLKLNQISGFMLLFTYLIGFLVSIYIIRSRDEVVTGDNQFLTYFLWTLSGASGVFLSSNLLFLLTFWEMVTAVFFLYINLGKGKGISEAARKTYVILGFADAFFLFGVIYIWVTIGNLDIDLISISTEGVLPRVAFFSFVISALAKAGAIPFHTWIPDISEEAPVSMVAFIPGSLDKLLGIYLLSLAMLKLFSVQPILTFIVMLIGALTIIIGVLLALIQHNLKKLLSYHAVSQVGYMVLGIATGNPVGVLGGLFHMLNNVIYKGGLFLCAGAIEKETGTTELEELGGLYRKMPFMMISNLILALAISGVPPLNGFTSKWMVYQGVLLAGQPVFLVLAVFGSALTLASFLKVIYSVYFGGASNIFEKAGKPSLLMTGPISVLAILCIFFGIFPGFSMNYFFIPMEFNVLAKISPAEVLAGLSFTNTLWKPYEATVALIIGLVIGVGLYLFGKIFNYREESIFTGGEKFGLEERRFPGTGLYLTIFELPFIGTFLKDCDRGSYDLYNITKIIGWKSIVEKLKNLHDGILSTYLSWCIIGLMIIMSILMRG